jgi:hypothetical protein
MVFMPLTWLVVAGVVFYFFGWQYALASIPLSITLGWIALFTLERAAELAGWARALLFYLTQKESFLRLYIERRQLIRQLETNKNSSPG